MSWDWRLQRASHNKLWQHVEYWWTWTHKRFYSDVRPLWSSTKSQDAVRTASALRPHFYQPLQWKALFGWWNRTKVGPEVRMDVVLDAAAVGFSWVQRCLIKADRQAESGSEPVFPLSVARLLHCPHCCDHLRLDGTSLQPISRPNTGGGRTLHLAELLCISCSPGCLCAWVVAHKAPDKYSFPTPTETIGRCCWVSLRVSVQTSREMTQLTGGSCQAPHGKSCESAPTLC